MGLESRHQWGCAPLLFGLFFHAYAFVGRIQNSVGWRAGLLTGYQPGAALSSTWEFASLRPKVKQPLLLWISFILTSRQSLKISHDYIRPTQNNFPLKCNWLATLGAGDSRVNKVGLNSGDSQLILKENTTAADSGNCCKGNEQGGMTPGKSFCDRRWYLGWDLEDEHESVMGRTEGKPVRYQLYFYIVPETNY